MTWFDYIVIGIMVISILLSLWRGLIREILSLLGWIVAVVAANLFGPELALHLPDKIPGEAIKLLVAYAIIMVATVLLMAVVNMLIATILAATGLKLADKGLGGLFGAARGAVIVLSLAILAGLTGLTQTPFWQQAVLSPMIEASIHLAKPLFPERLKQYVKF